MRKILKYVFTLVKVDKHIKSGWAPLFRPPYEGSCESSQYIKVESPPIAECYGPMFSLASVSDFDNWWEYFTTPISERVKWEGSGNALLLEIFVIWFKTSTIYIIWIGLPCLKKTSENNLHEKPKLLLPNPLQRWYVQ